MIELIKSLAKEAALYAVEEKLLPWYKEQLGDASEASHSISKSICNKLDESLSSAIWQFKDQVGPEYESFLIMRVEPSPGPHGTYIPMVTLAPVSNRLDQQESSLFDLLCNLQPSEPLTFSDLDS